MHSIFLLSIHDFASIDLDAISRRTLPRFLAISFVLLFGKTTASMGTVASSDPTETTVAAGIVLSVSALRTEYASNPIGIDVTRPRLSWQILSDQRGTVQSAYQIQVAESDVDLRRGRNLAWDPGKVLSDQSVHVEYDGPALVSGHRYYWRVRIWDGAGKDSGWSDAAFWEMGLLNAADWKAQWIEPGFAEDTTTANPAPMLRSDFVVDGAVESARLYVTSRGLNEVELNGQRVGDRLFTPGWTSYNKRLQYETYDVSSLLKPGANAIGAWLGDGWFRGRLAWGDQRNIYGTKLALLAQIVIDFTDGRTQVVGTDGSWKSSTGPILSSSIYDGEVYDARLEQTGWSRTGFDDNDWKGVAVIDRPSATLVAPAGPAVRRIEEISPVRIFKAPNGETVVDLGQNMVGWVRLRVQGPAGTTVKLRHAEVLDKYGNFYTENLRAAKASLEYTLRGGGEEVYEPRFTFMGFQYVAVEGYPGELTPDAITGIVVHSDMPRTGAFETSNPMLNRLQHNIVWGQKGNFLDVPTDTPARDERLGWTGDAQAFAPTAAFNFQVASFFTKWLADVAVDQKSDGSIPWVIPDVLPDAWNADGSAGWGDIATIGPWTMYLAYGDVRLLENQYESMRRWVDFIRADAGDDLLWGETHTFGDWLAFSTTDADYPGATTDKDYIATVFFAHSTDLVASAAAVLGKQDDARRYRELFERIREAFIREYVTETGRIASNTQTVYALALEYDLLPTELREEAGRRLAADVEKFGHLTTGFLGTPHLAPALQHTGHLDLAYKLLQRKEYPSWLYPITRGATTMWERWDGIKSRDSTFQDVGMNSFNHYAYGAIGDWMYRVVAGIALDPEQPGYKHILIRPEPGGGLTSASASLESQYGTIASSWEWEGDTFRLVIRVPPNTSATVRLPGASLESATEGDVPLMSANGVTRVVAEEGAVRLKVGAGEYSFSYPSARKE